MPGGNRKGPVGRGPRTGRGLGYCADNDQPGYAAGQQPTQGFGRGFGWRGRGRGWRRRFNFFYGGRRGRGSFPAFSTSNDPEIEALKTETKEIT